MTRHAQSADPSQFCVLRTALIVVAVAGILRPATYAAADDRSDFFETNIRPLLVEKCVSCHGPDSQEGDLRLDSRSQVLRGTTDVEALVAPGNASESRLLQVLRYSEDDVQMPPKGKLTDAEIAAVEHWIQSGAAWPESNTFGTAAAFDPEGWKNHWAFQPIADPEVPATGSHAVHSIDAFVRRKLSEKQIQPAPRADGRTLARRLAYAVTGLPPTPEDLQAAQSAGDAQALSKWLDDYATRLLSMPQFGERWARYWLDISRYADTKGYLFTQDREYKDAWKFREWVIGSLNNDMPYDEFLRRQIAADQLPGSDDPNQLAAMGFLTLGRRFLGNKHDIIDDRIDVLSRGTLGLTVSCARCHDHKFDPIPAADYYSLYGIFASSDEPNNEPSPLRLVDKDKPYDPVVFLRGSPSNRGDKVPRRFLTAISSDDAKPFSKGSGRLELAESIASAENPLTARVAVNRIWMRLFRNGLVDSPSDFGVRTPVPSHPELLDHLSSWFIKHNWSRKKLIKYIVMSETWRQSSAARPELAEVDPDNRLLCRMPRRRLDFEAFRDSVLKVAGVLDATVGGTSVDITAQPFTNRRTVYARIDRQNLPGTFRTFDFASPDSHSPKRFETTVPQQALFGLNSPFMMEHAEKIAATAIVNDSTTVAGEIFRRVLQREPSQAELSTAAAFLDRSQNAAREDNVESPWSYGYGEISTDRTKLLSFTKYPAFHEDRWSGGPKLPDPKLGWSFLNSSGGHTGGDLKQTTIRRWTARDAGTISITSTVKHAIGEGDGINAHVFHNEDRIATTSVHNSSSELNASAIRVNAGDTISFVADLKGTIAHDSFDWQAKIRPASANERLTADSKADFAGAGKELSPNAQLAQILLLSNEFLFVD